MKAILPHAANPFDRGGAGWRARLRALGLNARADGGGSRWHMIGHPPLVTPAEGCAGDADGPLGGFDHNAQAIRNRHPS